MTTLSATYRAIENELAEVRQSEAGKSRSRQNQPRVIQAIAALSSSEMIGSEPAKRNREHEENGQRNSIAASTDRRSIASYTDVVGRDCMWASDIYDDQRSAESVTKRNDSIHNRESAAKYDGDKTTSSDAGVERLFRSDDASRPASQYARFEPSRDDIQTSNLVEQLRANGHAISGELRRRVAAP